MSIWGSFNNAIFPDYFGDEFGLPLPPPQSSIMKNGATTTQPSELGNTGVTKAALKDTNNGRMADKKGALAYAPIFDGLYCFETLVSTDFE
ncbi:hypothetical protein ES319_A12G010800v1 [Gossypium barbadense]|uniref:Uncharacterized protein n=1 Tax=Gossypium barbadense TaxID=3634 RepID=A0A2P5X4J2_GOSBA|nr:hypothetical protein ES319_A12G010800v1 [Gossypium barbadense]PPR98241.1 hypothetical protein GOBAR_AA22425 [Gossypium barbadense]